MGPVAAPFPARLHRRDAPGLQMERRPRDLLVVPPGLMVGGGRPHARCRALVLQVPYQVGQRSTPRGFGLPPCPVGWACCVAGWSTPPLGFPAGCGVSVRCGDPPIFSVAATVGSSHRGWVGGAGGVAASPVGTPPLGRGLLTRAAARAGFPGLRTAGRQPGRWCVPGLGPGRGWGPGDREMTVL